MTKQTPVHVTIFITLLLLLNQAAFSQSWNENGINVGSGGAPDIATDRNNGDVHIVWASGSVDYAEYDKDGNLLQSGSLPNTSGINGGYSFGPAIAVDTEGNPHISYAKLVENDRFDIYYTKHNGSGWTGPDKIESMVHRGYAIRMAIDEDDEVHIIRGEQVLADDITPSEATYIRIKDNEVVFKKTGLDDYRPDDHVDIATFGSNDVHILLGNPDPTGSVNYYRSDTNGNQLIGPQNIIANHISNRTGSPSIHADKNNTVHVVYGANNDSQNGGSPSVRYQRRENGVIVKDLVITDNNELSWTNGTGVGLGSIASNNNGSILVAAYHLTDGGALQTRSSNDGGDTWSEPVQIASKSGGFEGRDKATVASWGNHFFITYENFGTIKFRHWKALGAEPVADAGGPYTEPEGKAILFDASQSTTGSSDFIEYAWDWDGDGIFDDITDQPAIEKTFDDNLTATATLQVTDVDNRIATQDFSITIQNVKPSVTIQGASTVDEGSEITYSVDIIDPGTADTHDVEWNFGDGNTGTGPSVAHTFVDNGSFSVVVTVTDDDGGETEKTLAVTVQNVAPVATMDTPFIAVINKPVTLSGSATDPGVNDIITYDWDLNNDGTFEVAGTQVTHTFGTQGTFPITFRATDNDGAEHILNGQVIVGMGAPEVSSIPDQQITEGSTFTAVNLDNYVTDPDHLDSQIIWSYYGNSELLVTLTSRTLTVTPPNVEWSGTETLHLTATDPTGQKDSTTVRFIVEGVNDDPVITKIPNQSVREGEPFSQVVLDNFVSDPDHPDATLTWTVSGQQHLQIIIINRIAQITPLDPNWFGTETVTFTVRDPLGGTASGQVVYTVNSFNDPPQIANIPSQTIQENQLFTSISLNNYVQDPDNDISELSWSAFGNTKLIVSINPSDVAAIAVADSEFAGTEMIGFVARDPGNQADTMMVAFTVKGINDPPVLNGFASTSINEDDSLTYSLLDLPFMIIDPDHDHGQLEYSLSGAQYLEVIYEPTKGLSIFGPPDWYGTEQIQLIVSDGQAFDTANMTITVRSMPDAPKPFKIVSPNSVFYSMRPDFIDFTWTKSYDPDPNEQVTFTWQLARDANFQDIILSISFITDTVYAFPAQQLLELPTTATTYYWKVTAVSTDGSSLEADLPASFTILITSVNDLPDGLIPTEFGLGQNYPNPFNPTTNIEFDMPESGQVRLEVYNALGARVRTLAEQNYPAGRHMVKWNARDDYGRKVSSGVYIYRLQAGQKMFTKKMILMQ